jgi:predicted transcriptional regulator of viral defense system
MRRGIDQQDCAISLLRQEGMLRLSEFRKAGVAAPTISRMRRRGLITRLSRGLYQLPDADLDAHQALAMASKRVPNGVACLVSAAAFHELTDTIPSHVWMAIGFKDRRPHVDDPALQIGRFGPNMLRSGIEEHLVGGVSVPIYCPAKTVIDLFRYRKQAGVRYRNSPGLNLANEGLREALRQRKATPADIARYAEEAGIGNIVRPYLDAMIANV